MIPEGMEGRGWKSTSKEIKHALSMLLANKVPVVAQGDGKQTRMYAEVAMGGGEGRRVAVNGGMSQCLALQ